ncbi:hypothetical protein [Nocardia sp. NPDC057272]|uniref:hypothetical protein n=1 Tax=Nocardia sp. NPDC057272 TaxID=3346079 RepID=UPI00363A742A
MIAVDVVGAAEAIVDRLRAQGMRANVDPAKLTPPCAWVSVTGVDHAYLGGCGVATVTVWLITTDRPPAIAHKALGELLGQALAVIDPTEQTATNEAITLTQSSQPLPAYRMTTTTEIR